MSASTKQLEAEIAELAPWFHNLHLPGGLQTNPTHMLGDFPAFKWQQIAPHIPDDLTGWRALDIGCNAGFYAVELAKRGAEVLGIDLNPHYLTQARWVCEQFGLQERLKFRQMQIYELAQLEEHFDLVIFMGVFYHLRYPLLGLDIVAQKVRRRLIFQTLLMAGDEITEATHGLPLDQRDALSAAGWPKMAFLEHEFAGDPTNWWAANRAGMAAMLRSSGLRITAQPEREIFICEPDPDYPGAAHSWNAAEYLAATGQPWEQAAGTLWG